MARSAPRRETSWDRGLGKPRGNAPRLSSRGPISPFDPDILVSRIWGVISTRDDYGIAVRHHDGVDSAHAKDPG